MNLEPWTSVCKVPANLKKLGSKEAQNSNLEVAILKLHLAARLCLFGVIPSNFGEKQKTCNWLGNLHKVSKMYFFSKR